MIWLLYYRCMYVWDTEWRLDKSCQEWHVLTHYIFQTKPPNPSRQVAKHVFHVLPHHLTEEVINIPDSGQWSAETAQAGAPILCDSGSLRENPGVITCSIGLYFNTNNISTSKRLLQTLNHHIAANEFCNQYKLTFLWCKKKNLDILEKYMFLVTTENQGGWAFGHLTSRCHPGLPANALACTRLETQIVSPNV